MGSGGGDSTCVVYVLDDSGERSAVAVHSFFNKSGCTSNKQFQKVLCSTPELKRVASRSVMPGTAEFKALAAVFRDHAADLGVERAALAVDAAADDEEGSAAAAGGSLANLPPPGGGAAAAAAVVAPLPSLLCLPCPPLRRKRSG